MSSRKKMLYSHPYVTLKCNLCDMTYTHLGRSVRDARGEASQWGWQYRQQPDRRMFDICWKHQEVGECDRHNH